MKSDAHIVPDGTMSHADLLGCESWTHFPEHMYRDVSDDQTIVFFAGPLGDDDNKSHEWTQWAEGAIGMVESIELAKWWRVSQARGTGYPTRYLGLKLT